MGVCGFFLSWLLYVVSFPSWAECLISVFQMMPFFVMGIHYRKWHENKKNNFSLNMKLFFLFLFAYCIGLYIDQKLLPYPRIGAFYGCRSYWTYMTLGMFGIAMMISLVTYWPDWSWLRYIGRNSLVFYFLNGFVYTVTIRFLMHYSLPYMLLIPTMLILAVVILAILAYLIKTNIPLIIGDKIAWNKLVARFGLHMQKTVQ